MVYVSTTAPATATVETAEYKVGDAGDQSAGFGTVTVRATSAVLPAGTGVAAKLVKASSLGAKTGLAAAFGAIAVGVAVGLAGVLYGSQKLLADASDDERRKGLRIRNASMASIVIFGSAIGLTAYLEHTVLMATLLVVFFGICSGLNVIALPRVQAEIAARKAANDPTAMAAMKSDLFFQWWGLLVGIGCALTAVVARVHPPLTLTLGSAVGLAAVVSFIVGLVRRPG